MKFAALFAFTAISSVYSQAPNDECVDAVEIPSDATFPYTTDAVDFSSSTENAEDPLLSCTILGSLPPSSLPPSTVLPSTLFPSTIATTVLGSIWYKWTASVSGTFDFSTLGSTDGFDSPLFLAVGIFQGNDCSVIDEVACTPFLNARGVEIVQGETYFIKVEGFIYDQESKVVLTVNPTPPPPTNDECASATAIPPEPSFPYTTDAVDLFFVTENPDDPLLSCNAPFIFAPSLVPSNTLPPSTPLPSSFQQQDGETVWYAWTPSVSGQFNFGTLDSTDGFGSPLFTTIGIFQGGSCDTLEEVACSAVGNTLRGFDIVAGETYFIKVGGLTYGFGGTLVLTVMPTPPPPPNDECSNAIVVDPVAGVTVSGDTSDAFFDDVGNGECGTSNDFGTPSVWYTFTTGSDDLLVVASTCNDATSFDTKISVYSGENCGALECVGGLDDSSGDCGLQTAFSFVASSSTTYWVLLHGYQGASGTFDLTFASTPNFFTLIDAQANSPIGAIGAGDYIYYGFVPSAKLNIQANFAESTSVDSVRVTFDNPARSFCEGNTPYTVFGDSNGDYAGATIPLGTRLVTATPYARSGCRGTAGTTLTQEIEVFGCDLYFSIYDASSDLYVTDVYDGDTVSNLPCDVNVEAILFCGFEIQVVRIELLDTVSNEVVKARNERVAPYFLFGNSDSDIFSGSIAEGSYSLKAIVDGIEHPTISFTVEGACS